VAFGTSPPDIIVIVVVSQHTSPPWQTLGPVHSISAAGHLSMQPKMRRPFGRWQHFCPWWQSACALHSI
jgi:hypothetical protein